MLKFVVEEKLELRLVSRRDKDELFSLITDNIDYLQEWLGWANSDSSDKDTSDFIARVRRGYINDEELPLVILKDGRIIGTISLFRIDLVNRSGEIGYWLVENAQGNGIITKCCTAIIDYSFTELNLNRIVIKCATENFKSQAIPERLGFTKEGISRQVQWLHDRFVGLTVYSLLKEEWKDIEGKKQ